MWGGGGFIKFKAVYERIEPLSSYSLCVIKQQEAELRLDQYFGVLVGNSHGLSPWSE